MTQVAQTDPGGAMTGRRSRIRLARRAAALALLLTLGPAAPSLGPIRPSATPLAAPAARLHALDEQLAAENRRLEQSAEVDVDPLEQQWVNANMRAESYRADNAASAMPARNASDAAWMQPGGAAAIAVSYAMDQLGKPYRYAANGPDMFDCSGLTRAAYLAAGIVIPRVAANQFSAGTQVAVADLLPGDLVFFADNPADPATIHHVGLYIGGGLMVHAPHTGDVVRITSIDRDSYAGAVRVVPDGPLGAFPPSGIAASPWLEPIGLVPPGIATAGRDPVAADPGVATPIATPTAAGVDIPAVALLAYVFAQNWAAGFDPNCKMSWSVLAAIGRIESNHGRHFGSTARFSPTGDVTPNILGPVLNGASNTAAIRDTDRGRWDGDPVWDRAVGPMQFIPSTWQSLGRDGNGDGIANPNNFVDAAVTAAAYLCRNGGGSLSDVPSLTRAVFAYNHSLRYVAAVITWASFYQRAAGGALVPVPTTLPTSSPPATSAPPRTASPTPTTTTAPKTQHPTTSSPPPGTAPQVEDASSLVEACRRSDRSPAEELDATLDAIEHSHLNAVSYIDSNRAAGKLARPACLAPSTAQGQGSPVPMDAIGGVRPVEHDDLTDVLPRFLSVTHDHALIEAVISRCDHLLAEDPEEPVLRGARELLAQALATGRYTAP
ncbi:MAG: hypothetical protein QOI55_2159 [Actinomycetota bacterium]|nr:hypothetical protein [Actinomycetota bacterium]